MEAPQVGGAWQGKAYRVESGYRHSRGTTAGDVVRYEQQELGNDYGIMGGGLAELDRYPASDIVWVTATKRAAARYASEGGVKEVEGFDLPPNSRIIATDGDGGYLVLQNTGCRIAEAQTATRPPTIFDLDGRYTLLQLQDMAKARGLSTSGNKHEIARRLIDANAV